MELWCKSIVCVTEMKNVSNVFRINILFGVSKCSAVHLAAASKQIITSAKYEESRETAIHGQQNIGCKRFTAFPSYDVKELPSGFWTRRTLLIRSYDLHKTTKRKSNVGFIAKSIDCTRTD